MTLTYGYLTGAVRSIVGDTPGDGDHVPDIVSIDGLRATVVPNAGVVQDSVGRIVYLPKPIDLGFDNTGVLRLKHHIDENGDPTPDAVSEIPLVSTDDTDRTPVDWTYQMRVTAPSIQTLTFTFKVPTDVVQDLVEIVPVASSGGTQIVRGPAGSPYLEWIEQGNEGSYEDFLETLKSTVPGPPGGSDAATAAWIEAGPLTGAALESAVTATAVTSLDVSRIRAVPEGDPLPSDLQDGDLVVRYIVPGASYFEDFTDSTLGAPPDGFTPRLESGGVTAWSVAAVPDASGGKALVWEGQGARRMLSWDAIDDDLDRADVEVLARWRSIDSTIVVGAAARMSGAVAASAHGYRAGGTAPTNVLVAKYVTGTNVSLSSATRPAATAGEWHYTRFRVHGEQISARIWPATDPEPGDWQVSAIDTDIADPGWVGVFFTTAGQIEFDWIAAGTGGRQASMP